MIDWGSMPPIGRAVRTSARLAHHIPSITPIITTQGGLLSPLTFGSFMEQLHDLIKLKIPGVGTKIGRMIVPLLMYTDDVTGLVHSPEEMKILITNITLFCTLFGIKINASKTFVVIFHGPRITLISKA